MQMSAPSSPSSSNATPSRSYHRVSSSEPGDATATATVGGSGETAASFQRQQSSCSISSAANRGNAANANRTFSEKITDKIVAFAWVLAAVVTAYWTDSLSVLLMRPTASPKMTAVAGLLQLAAVGLGINTILVAYLTCYLPYVKGLTDSSAWEVYCPRVIPIMTLTGIITALFLIRAVWPVWGFLSPLILGIEAMGCLFALHFVPVWPQ